MTVNFGSRKTDCNNEVAILTGLSQGWHRVVTGLGTTVS